MCVDLPVWNPEPLVWGFALESEGFAASSGDRCWPISIYSPFDCSSWKHQVFGYGCWHLCSRLPHSERSVEHAVPFLHKMQALWLISSWFRSRFQERSHSAQGLLSPAVHFVRSEPWRLVDTVSAQAPTYSSFLHLETIALVMGPGFWAFVSASVVADFEVVRSRVSKSALGVVPAKHRHRKIPLD